MVVFCFVRHRLHDCTQACSLSRGEAATHLPGVISGPQHCRGRRPNTSDSRPVCSGAGPREVCLVGAASRRSGNVMVAGRPVCDDEWGLEDAAVVCRQLGFPGVERATRESEFGNVSPLFAMDNVRCGGNESRLDQCRHKAGDDCNGGEAAGVVCALASPAQLPPPCRRRGAVCLAGGGDGHSGNVYFEGQPVCHNGWDFADANVVCKSLGHPGASNFTLGGQFGAATSYFSASGVRCRGDEASLGQCPHLAGGRGCSTEDVAGVVCLKTEV